MVVAVHTSGTIVTRDMTSDTIPCNTQANKTPPLQRVVVVGNCYFTLLFGTNGQCLH